MSDNGAKPPTQYLRPKPVRMDASAKSAGTADNTWVRIGGHDGMTVYRSAAGINKKAEGPIDWPPLLNEYAALTVMDGNFAPAPIAIYPTGAWTVQQDVGATNIVEVTERGLLHGFTRMLHTIRDRGWRHGDLMPSNIVVNAQGIWALDWQESHLLSEPMIQGKRLTTDGWQLMEAAANMTNDTTRVARRWQKVLEYLGARDHSDSEPLPLNGRTFVDLGCFDGLFPALAASEGMVATGVDIDDRAIEEAMQLWRDKAVFVRMPMEKFVNGYMPSVDVAMFCSAFPYLVEQIGEDRAENVLGKIIEQSRTLFFETQYHGDGPGPYWLKADADCQMFLHGCGATTVTSLARFAVPGRDAERTLWAVE